MHTIQKGCIHFVTGPLKCTVKKSEKTHVTESDGLRNQQRDKQFAKNLSNDL